MPNMKQIIANHNKTLINTKNTKPITQKNCNCRQSKTCPLNGQCRTKGVVYQATVTRHDNNKEETYIGLTENTFFLCLSLVFMNCDILLTFFQY